MIELSNKASIQLTGVCRDLKRLYGRSINSSSQMNNTNMKIAADSNTIKRFKKTDFFWGVIFIILLLRDLNSQALGYLPQKNYS
jgi:hypothetical protein